jgi:acyl carrier protein
MIKNRIVEFVKDNFDVELLDGDDFRGSGVDSLSFAILIAELEDVFGIEFNEDDLDPLKLVVLEDLVELVGKYV